MCWIFWPIKSGGMDNLKTSLLAVLFGALCVGLLVCSAPQEIQEEPSVEGIYRLNKSLLLELRNGSVVVISEQLGIRSYRKEGVYEVRGEEVRIDTRLMKGDYRVMRGDGVMLVSRDTLILERW